MTEQQVTEPPEKLEPNVLLDYVDAQSPCRVSAHTPANCTRTRTPA
jgi:hypothetical protein